MTLSILWADGFDNYNNAVDLATEYAQIGYYNGFGTGRTNGKCIVGRNGYLVYQNLPAESDLTLAVAVQPTSTSVGFVFTFRDIVSGDILATFDFSNTNLVVFTCASGSYQTAIPLLPQNNWSHLQCRVQSGASGSYTIMLNGTSTIASGSGLNITGSSGTITTMNAVYLTGGGGGGELDDLLICTGGLPGDCRVQTDFPISNASVQFTPLANTNWQEVSETSMDGDTSYNSSSTVGQTDTFNFTPLSVPAGSTIIALFVRTAAAKTDAGSRSLQNKIVSGSNSALGTSVGLSTSYEYQQDNFTSFLSGLGLLTQSGINSTTIGYTLSA